MISVTSVDNVAKVCRQVFACKKAAYTGTVCSCRSYKAEQLAMSSWVEICSWNAATQQQFRLLGPVEFIDDDTTDHSLQCMRQEEWRKLDTPAVLQWYQNADRAPGHTYKSPVELPVDQHVSSLPTSIHGSHISQARAVRRPLSSMWVACFALPCSHK